MKVGDLVIYKPHDHYCGTGAMGLIIKSREQWADGNIEEFLIVWLDDVKDFGGWTAAVNNAAWWPADDKDIVLATKQNLKKC